MQTVNPLLQLDDLIDYAAIRPEHAEPAVRHWMAQAEKALEAAESPQTPAEWSALEPLGEAFSDLGRAWGAVGHLQSVADSPQLRDAFNRLLPDVTALYLRASQSQPLYQKYKAIEAGAGFAALSPVQQRIVKREIRDFVLSGAELPEEKRAAVTRIQQELSALSQKFSENLLDATNAFEFVTEDPKDLAGIPEETLSLYRESARAAGRGGWRVTLQFPSYLPAMQYCENRAVREKLYRAFATRAAEFDGGRFDNTPLIRRILELRAEEASLLGFPTYAHLSLATKMAHDPEEVIRFLLDLAQKSRPAALRDAAAIDAFAREKLGIDRVAAWDRALAAEQLREARYSYSDAEARRYFTENAVFRGLFKTVETLFGIEIRPAAASVWHPDVKYFQVFRQGTPIAAFYADLYARAGKRSGAWMDGERTRAYRRGKLQTPVAYLVTNFAKPAPGRPATLTHDEVTTLFHEFGHTLHHLLTAQTEAEVSGINGVEWDAVECPSQFLENFAWDRTVMKSITAHAETGEAIPDALFSKMLAAKNFQSGAASVRQVEFALFDMRLHAGFDAQSDDPMALLDAVRREVAVVLPPAWNRFPQSFSHIFAGGYAAGYYSYKWAEVLSADAFEAFEEEGILNPETGRRFLKEILERGSSRDAMENFVAFRGRKPSIEALLRQTGILAK